MAKVRVEWVKVGRKGEDRDPSFLEQVVGEPAIIEDIAAVAVLTDPAPAWPSESGATVDRGYARVTVLEGAVLVAWGTEDDAGSAEGVLAADVGKPVYVAIRAGHVLAFKESPELPSGAGGAASELTLQDILEAVTEPLDKLPPRPLVTDLARYPDQVDVEVSGADTDLLIAAAAGQRHFVFSGWLQTDIDVVLQFKSAAANLGKPVKLLANDILEIGDIDAERAEFWTGLGEGLSVEKSTAATLKGKLRKKTV